MGDHPAPRATPVHVEIQSLDQALFDAVADTPTPRLDGFFVGLSQAADNSKLWIATAAGMALLGGPRGRRAAGLGLAAIGLASAVTNLALKPVAARPRPTRSSSRPVPDSRWVERPLSASFPSGHSASAVAFASAAGESAPAAWGPLHLAATLVSYSRVHTGVHYPSDVAIGTVIGALAGWTVRRVAGLASSDSGGVRPALCGSERTP